MPIVSCQICSKDFYASPGHIQAGWGKYCSLACRNIYWTGEGNPRWSGDAGHKTCKRCGNPFHVKPSAIKNGKGKQYCSPECRHASERRIRHCRQCGKEFHIPRSRDARTKGEGTYCSAKCRRDAVAPVPNCTCEQCGVEFYTKNCELIRKGKKGVGRFCSMYCKARWMSCHAEAARTGKRSNSGKRDDLGIYVRSGWEANYCRYLNWLLSLGEIVSWEYEVDTFEFKTIKRGTRFYTPDFKITEKDGTVVYHEVKGYMDAKSATKLRRMAKFYPHIKVILIDRPVYQAIERQARGLIPNWEGERL